MSHFVDEDVKLKWKQTTFQPLPLAFPGGIIVGTAVAETTGSLSVLLGGQHPPTTQNSPLLFPNFHEGTVNATLEI